MQDYASLMGDKNSNITPQAALKRRLSDLRKEHRDLDTEISSLSPTKDQVRIQRLKKRKLSIKDQITRLEASLHPDIIA